MKIGALAKKAQCTVQTIRHYEKEGLLRSSQRSDGNFRIYDREAVKKLLFIRHCRNLDMTLAEIKQLLDISQSAHQQCTEIDAMMDAHIKKIKSRIQELNTLKSQLEKIRDSCDSDRTIEQCGILKCLAEPS